MCWFWRKMSTNQVINTNHKENKIGNSQLENIAVLAGVRLGRWLWDICAIFKCNIFELQNIEFFKTCKLYRLWPYLYSHLQRNIRIFLDYIYSWCQLLWFYYGIKKKKNCAYAPWKYFNYVEKGCPVSC